MLLELVAEDGVALERASVRGGRTAWERLCEAPCRGYVPAYGRYRIAPPDRRPSEPFTLPAPPGTFVTLKADSDGRVWTRDSPDLTAKRNADRTLGLGLLLIAVTLQ